MGGGEPEGSCFEVGFDGGKKCVGECERDSVGAGGGDDGAAVFECIEGCGRFSSEESVVVGDELADGFCVVGIGLWEVL